MRAARATVLYAATSCAALGIVMEHDHDKRGTSSVELRAQHISGLKEKDRVLISLPRGRLGNRLFETAALLSMAKEFRSYAVIPQNKRYHPDNTPQLKKLKNIFMEPEDVEQLNAIRHKCHMWDRLPITIDANISKLGEWTLPGETHGTIHEEPKLRVVHDGNKAADWVEAMRHTKINGAHCQITELDGFYQRNEFFSKHFDWIRELFWDDTYADRARRGFDKIRVEGTPSSPVRHVAIHFRLGDYIQTNRNLEMSYYQDAISLVKQRNYGHRLACYIFSDDVKLAVEMAKELELCEDRVPVEPWKGKLSGAHFHSPMVYVDEKVSFYMMAQMDNIIIADSSYSFWAARLSPKDPLVVAPALDNRFKADFAYLLVKNNEKWLNINTTAGLQKSQLVKDALMFNRWPGERIEVGTSEWGE